MKYFMGAQFSAWATVSIIRSRPVYTVERIQSPAFGFLGLWFSSGYFIARMLWSKQ